MICLIQTFFLPHYSTSFLVILQWMNFGYTSVWLPFMSSPFTFIPRHERTTSSTIKTTWTPSFVDIPLLQGGKRSSKTFSIPLMFPNYPRKNRNMGYFGHMRVLMIGFTPIEEPNKNNVRSLIYYLCEYNNYARLNGAIVYSFKNFSLKSNETITLFPEETFQGLTRSIWRLSSWIPSRYQRFAWQLGTLAWAQKGLNRLWT